MKRLLNTLFVLTQGTYLARQREAVLVRVEKKTKLRVPVHTLGGIVCFGRVGCSPALMGLCGENGVAISFLTERGRFLARVQGAVSGNVLLRREQYRRADDEDASAEIARAVVVAKVANCRTVLLRAARECADSAMARETTKAATHLADLVELLREQAPLDTVRGREGEAGRTYFGVFDHLIVAQENDFYFRGRSRRPPMDSMNALLSFVYTLLAHDVRAALESAGLDPAVGFLHRDRPGRLGLALDLMEELRPLLADRLTLSLVNRRQVKGGGFETSDSGGVTMNDATRKTVIQAYQTRKQEELHHPYIGEKVAIGLLPHVQAMLMARFLRGDLDGYPPFVWR